MTISTATIAHVPSVFKVCSNCDTRWHSITDFIHDPTLDLVGYMPTFDELTSGLFLFNHRCGTTLACTVGQFAHLYDGPVFEPNRRGDADCPGHCLNKTDLAPCPEQCCCAFVREIMQVIAQLPKSEYA